MFGSNNPFGQSSSTSFGSQSSVFGQNTSATTNPFAPKPFGSPNPFGAQTGGSIFGGTSTGVFGQPSMPSFGASTAPAFGSSTPAFGASSSPAFGTSSGSSLFGQKPAFGGFGSSPSQSSPFGNSTFQPTQSAFGSSSVFGSTSPFGASSQPAFGTSSTPAFGASTTPAFGASTTPAFGATSTPAFGATSTPAFGATSTPAFGSTSPSIFGNTGGSFGVSSSPAFGSTPFGASTTSIFGASSTPAFGASTASTFGSPTVPAFGASNTSSFSFGSTPSFGQSTSTFGSTTFGATTSPFGGQSSAFGAPTSTPAFGSSPGFGQQPAGGTRIAPYSSTTEVDGGTGTTPAGKLESISAMPQYKDKSHEELRWEDYQRGDKGGPNPSGQVSGGTSFPAAQPNPFSTGTFGQPAGNPFSSSATTNTFAIKPSGLVSTGFGSSPSVFSTTFSGTSSSPFGTTTSTPSFGSTTNAFGTSSTPSIFGSSTSAFNTSLFSSTMPGSNSNFSTGLNFGNTQPAGLFNSSTPSFVQTTSAFVQPNTGFQQTTPAFGPSPFNTPTAFTGGFFNSSTMPSFSTTGAVGFSQPASLQSPFQMSQQAQTSSNFSFPNTGQTQIAPSGGLGNSNIFNQGIFGQSASTQSNMVMQPTPITNPFGALPAIPQMSIGRVGSSPSIQYGISSMPVPEKPIQVRTSSLLVPRHLSQRRIKLPPRKYLPKADGLRMPFFADDEEPSSTPKADALFIPRENPRSLFIRPIEQWPERDQNGSKENSHLAVENGEVSEPSAIAISEFDAGVNSKKSLENGFHKDRVDRPPPKSAERINGFHDHAQKEADPKYVNISGYTSGDATTAYEHGTDIEALLPKLYHADYYTEPSIQELAAKERAEPGFCRRVKDFVVGRRGYGCIKFYGETDVRKLDLESIVQFNNREVVVYANEGKKPPVGQGLNKPAEVTLLNIKCVNKKTGQQYTDGPNVEKYKGTLMKKTQEQGAEFVSYDPVKGEWKFKVNHFSCYGFVDVDVDF